MAKLFWRIQGYDSLKLIFEQRIPYGSVTERQMQELLKALAAKAGLDFEEIVGAYAKKRTKLANDLLEVHHDARHHTWMCGENPHFAARIIKQP